MPNRSSLGSRLDTAYTASTSSIDLDQTRRSLYEITTRGYSKKGVPLKITLPLAPISELTTHNYRP
jgi:hypothetical protein